MSQTRAEKIVATQNELNRLLAEAKAERLAKNQAAVAKLIAGMSLDEMREIREVLNERISAVAMSDAIDDE